MLPYAEKKMIKTPETDHAIKESNGQWSFALADVSRMMELQRNELIRAIKQTLKNNMHLADGDDCTLIDLKNAIKKIK
jgi:hypothetical protein